MSIASPHALFQRAARKLSRLKLRWSLPGVRVVFDPSYVPPPQRGPSLRGGSTSSTLELQRGARVIAELERQRLVGIIPISRPPKLRIEDAMRVHASEYLATLDEPAMLERCYGSVATRGMDLVAVLDAHRAAAGGTVHAVEIALRYPWLRSPVVNLGGGFHHARRDRCSGFCALNDVAIAIDRARSRGFRGNVLIVDLDFHQGDGTRALFADDPSVYTYSVHAQSIDTSPAVASQDVELGPAVGNDTYLRALSETLPEAFARAKADLVVYVAGADVAATDALGSWRLGADAISERDRRVLDRARGTPTVVVLAGGYGPEAWRYPARMLLWLTTREDMPIPTLEERELAGMRRIRRSLSVASLRGQKDAEELVLSDEDIYGELVQKAPDQRLLGFYSTFGLEVAVERYGLGDHLRSKGYPEFVMVADERVGGIGHGLRIWADASRTSILLELVLRDLFVETAGTLLCIEWLLLQDPKQDAVQLLPGQKHPGLGCLRLVVGMLVMAAERLRYDGVTHIPSHYHVAAKSRRLFAFLDPADEAYFLALSAATRNLDLASATRVIGRGEVVHAATGAPARYRPARMVLATSAALKERLMGAEYSRGVEEAARGLDLK